jgi:hypothetical protein
MSARPRMFVLLIACAMAMATSGRAMQNPASQDIDYAGANPGDEQSRAFNHLVTNVLFERSSLLDAYIALNALPPATDLTVRRNENQLVAMVDTFVGRYDEATERMRANSYDSSGEVPIACPESLWKRREAVEWIGKTNADTRILLINEAHNLPITRALIYRLLPELRAKGFDTLAMETLKPADPGSAKALADTDLSRRGYPLDNMTTGVYVREPIDGELVREAIRLGYTLVAYDAEEPRGTREMAQAKNIARFLSTHPDARLLVLGGYAHITRSWMAGQLRPLIEGKMVAIDQYETLGGCFVPNTKADQYATPEEAMTVPFVFTQRDEAWARNPAEYDVSVVTPPRKIFDGERPGWLNLGGARKRFPLDRKLCDPSDLCLVEARYAGESDMAVPADRFILKRTDSHSALFLRPGSYVLRVSGPGGTTLSQTSIEVAR